MNEPIQLNESVWLYAGNCLEIIDTFPENCIDAIVTDPPYHLTSIVKRFGGENPAPAKHGTDGLYARASRGFMGKEWDGGDIAFRPETWAKVLRVLKPGGHLVAFSAPKCSHRMVCAIEDAGFEIRDSLQWMFGTGFPKSHDISKAIDKVLGAERVKVHVPIDKVRNPKSIDGGHGVDGGDRPWMAAAREKGFHEAVSDEAVSDEAVEWQGWGTALKPAFEPICLARKPLSEATVAANVLRWGTGAINIGASRIEANDGYTENAVTQSVNTARTSFAPAVVQRKLEPSRKGRWPANVCHDGSDEVVGMFPQSKGQQGDVRGTEKSRTGDENTVCYGEYDAKIPFAKRNDSGSAARFFYSAKASAKDRIGSKHPTVKPIALMRWLVRMVTPPNGVVLDPFAGTGTTGAAAEEEGFSAVLIEREDEYIADIKRRLSIESVRDDDRIEIQANAHVETKSSHGATT